MRRLLPVLAVLVLLVPAVGLSVLRQVGPEHGLAVRLAAFAPMAVLLYLAVLVVGGIVFVRGERGGRGLPVLVALAGIGLHVWWQVPHWSGESGAVEAKPAYTLTVMSTNLERGAADPAQVLRAAADHGVDILVVQEITPEAVTGLEQLGLAEAYPHRAGEPAPGTQGTMVFSSSPLLGAQRLPTHFGSWTMDVQAPGGLFRLYAVHTAPPTGENIHAWHRDLGLLREAIAGDRSLDLVVGDLNSSVDHRAFRELLEGRLRDAAEAANAGWQPTWPVNGGWKVLGIPFPAFVAIDHVLVGDQLAATEVDVVHLDDTDHRALVVQLAPAAP